MLKFPLDKESRFDFLVIAFALGSAAIAAAAFALRFLANEPGQPTDWADFGDYLGGLANPIFGLATVVLLVRTLTQSREASADNAKALTEQIAEMKRQRDSALRESKLADHRRRIDRALDIWEAYLETPVTDLERCPDQKFAEGLDKNTYTMREVLYGDWYRKEASWIMWQGQPERKDPWPRFWPKFGLAARYMTQMATYIDEYAAVAEDEVLVNFYRLHLKPAAQTLVSMRVISQRVKHSIEQVPEVDPPSLPSGTGMLNDYF